MDEEELTDFKTIDKRIRLYVERKKNRFGHSRIAFVLLIEWKPLSREKRSYLK